MIKMDDTSKPTDSSAATDTTAATDTSTTAITTGEPAPVDNGTVEKDVEMECEEEEKGTEADFTSENFKIELHGLPKFYGIGQIKKMLSQLSLRPHRIKPAGAGNPYLFVSFKNEQDRETALEKLEGYTWKKSVLTAKKAGPAPLSSSKKRKNEIVKDEPIYVEDGGEGIKKSKVEEEELNLSVAAKIKRATIPWVDIEYEKQLMDKYKEAENVLRSLGTSLKKGNKDLAPWLKSQKQKYDGLCCELFNTRPSPVIKQYRNKCEFTVGINPENNTRTVGFRLSSYKEGSTGVAPIEDLTHLPDNMKGVVKTFEEYIRESSLEPYNPDTREGFWRQLTVRVTRRGDIMAIVIMHPQSLNQVAINKVKQNLKNLFTTSTPKITSLYFQSFAQRESGKTYPYELVWGEEHIRETINGLTFQISPDAFFQTNTEGAELLYETVTEIAEVNDGTTLLDVCCGTGTIGVSMSKSAGQVLGVDVIEEAIECAKANAFANEVLNCQFFCGKAESILHQVMSRALFKDVVAVVDPPRAGLPGKAMAVLRKCEDINKLVYISCDAKLATKNFLDLGRPFSNTFQGAPFVPVKAIPIDMFPNTPHLELVILFERFDPDLYPPPDQTRFYSNKTKALRDEWEGDYMGDYDMPPFPGPPGPLGYPGMSPYEREMLRLVELDRGRHMWGGGGGYGPRGGGGRGFWRGGGRGGGGGPGTWRRY